MVETNQTEENLKTTSPYIRVIAWSAILVGHFVFIFACDATIRLKKLLTKCLTVRPAGPSFAPGNLTISAEQ